MKTEYKVVYEAPALTIVDVRQDGIICQSLEVAAGSEPSFEGFDPEIIW